MKSFLFTLFLISGFAFAKSADQVYVMPHTGHLATFGQVDLSQSAAVKNALAAVNGGTGWTYGQVPPTHQVLKGTATVAGYAFDIISGFGVAPVAGDTYTNNGNTFTIIYADIANGYFFTSHSGTATFSGNTLTRTSGSGSTPLTFFNNTGQSFWGGAVPLYAYVIPSTPAPTGMKLTMVGGGGAGGYASGVNSETAVSAAGNGGATCFKFISNPSGTYYYSIGYGGTGQSSNPGAIGGITVFGSGSTWYYAPGGLGGNPSAPASASPQTIGSPTTAATASSNCDYSIPGGIGSPGFTINSSMGVPGSGGNSFLSPGSSPNPATGGGAAGLGWGGGASGNFLSVNTTAVGANGSQGIIISDEFY